MTARITSFHRLCVLVSIVFVVCGLVGCHGGGQSAEPSGLESCAVSPMQAGLRGDLNGNGLPDVADAIGILRIVVGLDPANPLADCDGNGAAGVGDAIALLRCVVGLDSWPIGGGAATVGPDGGTVTTADGNVTLQVPAGALPSPINITVSPRPTYPLADGLVPGTCYQFGPDGTQFSQPAQLIISYDEDGLSAWMDEGTFVLHQLSGDAWEPVASSTVDVNTNTVSAPVSGFSSYAILGAPPEEGSQFAGPDGQTLLWVPGGSFMMGREEGGDDDERPVHQVTLSGFWIGRCEVTNELYRTFCEATGRTFPANSTQGDTHPVVHVSWDNAQAYCDHYGYTLPTEAQWEYAARGAAGSTYPWGDLWDGQRCCFYDNRGPGDATFPVGSFPAGASWCGALDMTGNVWEWCADWYLSTYYSISPALNPPGPSNSDCPEGGPCRILRGAAWNTLAQSCRADRRSENNPSYTNSSIGFRVAYTDG